MDDKTKSLPFVGLSEIHWRLVHWWHMWVDVIDHILNENEKFSLLYFVLFENFLYFLIISFSHCSSIKFRLIHTCLSWEFYPDNYHQWLMNYYRIPWRIFNRNNRHKSEIPDIKRWPRMFKPTIKIADQMIYVLWDNLPECSRRTCMGLNVPEMSIKT